MAGSGKSLSSVRPQAIAWPVGDLLSIDEHLSMKYYSKF